MTHPERNMVIVLIVSTMLIIFNIVAVTQGTADNYYNQVEQFMINLLPPL